MVVARSWGRRTGSSCLINTNFLFGKVKMLQRRMVVMVVQQGEYKLMPLNCTLKMVKYRIYFTTIQKIPFIGLPWWLSGKESTQFQSLIEKNPTCQGATKPMHHSYWDCAPEPGSCNYWAHLQKIRLPVLPRAHDPQQQKPPQWEARALQVKSSPRSPQVENACIATETQHSLNK